MNKLEVVVGVISAISFLVFGCYIALKRLIKNLGADFIEDKKEPRDNLGVLSFMLGAIAVLLVVISIILFIEVVRVYE